MRQPNAFAWLALCGWPLIVLGTYALRRSTARLSRTTAWMMVTPVMFLPALLNLPFARLDKSRIACLSIAVALLLFHRRELRLEDPWRRFPILVWFLFGVGALQTIRSNTDPLTFGILRLPGLGPRDLAWMIYEFSVDFALPFMIGQRVFRTERDVRDLLEVLSACVLVYAPLCLVELRLSPQLSNWVYGYFPHSFAQTVRGTGYRPVVFMNHGLSVAMFLFSGLSAALTLRGAAAERSRFTFRSLVAIAIQLLSKNLAALVYSGVAVVLQLWNSSRAKAGMVLAVVLVIVAYPALRVAKAFPTAELGEASAQISPERSASLMYRFRHEEALVARAMERPVFGWGEWGRSRVYSSWGERGDSWAGFKDISVTDGAWIIWLGASGLVGVALHMALLVVPLLRFVRVRRRMPARAQILCSGLALMVVLFCVDVLPNSWSDFLPLTYGGALLSLAATRSSARRRWRPTSDGTGAGERTSGAQHQAGP